MPIQKTFTTPNGAPTAYHVVKRIEVSFPAEFAEVNVQSFASSEYYAGGANPLWNTPMQMPLSDLSATPLESIEAWLVANPVSPFYGGTIVGTS